MILEVKLQYHSYPSQKDKTSTTSLSCKKEGNAQDAVQGMPLNIHTWYTIILTIAGFL